MDFVSWELRGYDGLAVHVDECLLDLGYEASDEHVGALALQATDAALETIEDGIASLIANAKVRSVEGADLG